VELKKSKILLISSDLILCEKIDKILKETIEEGELFVSGLDLLNRVINKHDIDLVLADYAETKEVLEDIEKISYISANEIPIIALLNPNEEDDIAKVIDSGIVDYIYTDRLSRLKLAIIREIKSSKLRKDYKQIAADAYKENSYLYKLTKSNNLNYSNSNSSNTYLDSALVFFRLFHSIPIGISLISATHNTIIDINDGYLELLELHREDILGRSALDLNLWKYPRERERIISFISKYGSIKNQEVTLLTKSGKEKIVLISAIYLPEEETSETTYLFMSLDITERKKMEEDLIKALAREKDLSILKTRFISMISHEFRTPLTTIMLSTDILRTYGKDWDEIEKEKHYKRIQSTILSLIQLLENVIIIGRIDTGEYEFNPEDIDIPSFFNATAEYSLANNASTNKISTLFEGDFKNILVDENLLSLILNNLLTNSIKYSEDGSNIELNVKVDRINETLIFSIKDYGIGIPENDIANIYESFYRAANVGNKSGFGLGLTIVKKCVDQLYGKITINSKLDEYTIVAISIPLLEYKKSRN
jgi:PAS domain S-box-containing protein